MIKVNRSADAPPSLRCEAHSCPNPGALLSQHPGAEPEISEPFPSRRRGTQQ